MELQETRQRDERTESATQQCHQGDITVTSSHTLSDIISESFSSYNHLLCQKHFCSLTNKGWTGKVKLCLLVMFSDVPDAASRPPAATRL